MMVEERRRALLDMIRDEGRVVAADAAQRFGRSEDSIRRDLRVLAAEGLVQRVRGGALPARPTRTFQERAVDVNPEIDALARGVSDRLTASGGLVVLDSGVTNLRIAEALPASANLVVVTSSPAIGAAASANGVEVIMLGGVVSPDIGASVDASALEALRSVRADVAVLGVCAVDPVGGISSDHAVEVAFKRAVIDSAAELIVAPTSDKIGTVAPFRVSEIEVVTTLVTTGLDRSLDDLFARLDLEVVVVGPAPVGGTA